jgi:hypothetical protein
MFHAFSRVAPSAPPEELDDCAPLKFFAQILNGSSDVLEE